VRNTIYKDKWCHKLVMNHEICQLKTTHNFKCSNSS